MIAISIDVTQLDKARFKTITRKNGKTAVFAELVLIETPNGQYGDFMVKQSVTKEERAAKVQLPIIGNGKFIGQTQGRPAEKPAAAEPTNGGEEKDDQVPF